MIYQFAQIIFSIPPSQIENERNFSLAGVITRARRASFTVENLSMLVFINKNKKIKDSIAKVEKMNLFEVETADFDDDIKFVEDYLKQTGEIDDKT